MTRAFAVLLSLAVCKRFDMGGLFEVIIIERRASQRAEALGNKPAEPSDYQMEIYQRKPTLAGEDRAQADGPRKKPPSRSTTNSPRAGSVWGRDSDWCGSLTHQSRYLPSLAPRVLLLLLLLLAHSPVGRR